MLRWTVLRCPSHYVTPLIKSHCWCPFACRTWFKTPEFEFTVGECPAWSGHLGSGGAAPTLLEPSASSPLPLHPPGLSRLACPSGPQHVLLHLRRKVRLSGSDFLCRTGSPLRLGSKYDSDSWSWVPCHLFEALWCARPSTRSFMC